MEMSRWSRCGLGGVVIIILVASLLAFAPGVLADDHTDDESSLGAGISGYMQSTAADADESVESGMWEQQFETAAAPDRAVERRAASLRDKLTSLQEQSQALEAAKRDGTLTGVAYTARASGVHAQLASLRAAIDRTADRAQRRGVETTDLDELGRSAGTVTGPDVSSVGRDIANAGRGPPDGVPGGTPGPPTDAGPPADGPAADGGPPDDPGSGTQGNGEGSPPEERGNGNQGNGDGGSPDERGNGNQGNGDGGSPDERGNGNQGNGDGGSSGDGSNIEAGGHGGFSNGHANTGSSGSPAR